MRQRPVFEGTFCATHAVSTNSLPYMRRKNFSDLAILLSRSHHQFVPLDLVGVDPVEGGRVGEGSDPDSYQPGSVGRGTSGDFDGRTPRAAGGSVSGTGRPDTRAHLVRTHPTAPVCS